MSGKQVGTRVEAAIDVAVSLGYPTTAKIEILQWPDGEIHDINSVAAPGTDFDNAPNGSRCYDVVNAVLYIKKAAGGIGSGVDGTWTAV